MLRKSSAVKFIKARSCGTKTVVMPIVVIVIPAPATPSDASNRHARPSVERHSWYEQSRGPFGPARQELPRAVHAHNEYRQQGQRCHSVPRIEVTIAEIGEKADKPDAAAGGQCPPGPSVSVLEWKLGQPHVNRADRDQHPAERDPIMMHEVHDPAFVDRAQLAGSHAEEIDVVRQEMSRGRLKHREAAGQNQAESRQHDKKPAVGDKRIHQPARVRVNLSEPWLHNQKSNNSAWMEHRGLYRIPTTRRACAGRDSTFASCELSRSEPQYNGRHAGAVEIRVQSRG